MKNVMRPFYLFLPVLVAVSGCATAPLSQQALGQKFPVAKSAVGDQVAQVSFSGDAKYETEKGVPLSGDPLICARDGVFRVNDDNLKTDRVMVRAGEEISVTSVIQWVNAGWRKTCWPFVAFTPESGAKYVVVNERIGGKGISALFTGVALQTCQVSVYKEAPSGLEPVSTRQSSVSACRFNER